MQRDSFGGHQHNPGGAEIPALCRRPRLLARGEAKQRELRAAESASASLASRGVGAVPASRDPRARQQRRLGLGDGDQGQRQVVAQHGELAVVERAVPVARQHVQGGLEAEALVVVEGIFGEGPEGVVRRGVDEVEDLVERAGREIAGPGQRREHRRIGLGVAGAAVGPGQVPAADRHGGAREPEPDVGVELDGEVGAAGEASGDQQARVDARAQVSDHGAREQRLGVARVLGRARRPPALVLGIAHGTVLGRLQAHQHEVVVDGKVGQLVRGRRVVGLVRVEEEQHAGGVRRVERVGPVHAVVPAERAGAEAAVEGAGGERRARQQGNHRRTERHQEGPEGKPLPHRLLHLPGPGPRPTDSTNPGSLRGLRWL